MKVYDCEQAEKIAFSLGTYLYDDCEKLEIVGSIKRKAEVVGSIDILYKPINYVFNLDIAGKKRKIRTFPIEVKIKKANWLDEHLHDRYDGRLHRYLIHTEHNIAVFLYPVMALENWGVHSLLINSSLSFVEKLRKIIKKKNFYIRDSQLFRDRRWIPIQDEKTFFTKVGLDYVNPEDR